MYAAPIAAQLAADSTAKLARSALPDAPTLRDDHPVRHAGPARRVSARVLRRLADRLVPGSAPVPT